ncbi:Sentrin-specific protease 7 [Takifugu flavidus]|uniref:Sentrin-specific protease 7 n=1 Tax=Takifugu flavidus TaxID=433684 RepID=A0A5C6PQB0_9TELE|nr:Sentrin-specific protease 7 [Takifugu flavidus]
MCRYLDFNFSPFIVVLPPSADVAEDAYLTANRHTHYKTRTGNVQLAPAWETRVFLCLSNQWAIMEQKRALKLPFAVDKDEKVSWTESTGLRSRHCDLQITNGGALFGHNQVAKNIQEMMSKEPFLILTDVLKSKEGRPYLERIKQQHSSHKQGQKEHQQCKEGFICKDRRASQRMAHDDNRNLKPRPAQMSPSLPSSRSRLQRKSQNMDDAGNDQENDLEEVIIGQDFRGSYRFSEVVVSWEPAQDKGGREDFTPSGIRDKNILHSWKRKKHDIEANCNETSKPKRHRLSVLRLSGKTGREGPSSPAHVYLQEDTLGRRVGRSAPSHICLGENINESQDFTSILLDDSGEDGREEPALVHENSKDLHLNNLDNSIVQFTVGANNLTEVLLPITGSSLEPVDVLGSPANTDPTEPIVLSSDEEEGVKRCNVPQRCSQMVHTQVSIGDAGTSPEEAKQQEEASDSEDTELLAVAVVDVPPVAISPPSKDWSMLLSFSSLYCGDFHAKSNGNLKLTDQNFIIPLKDNSEQVEVVLSLERKELCRYSVWEQQEMEAQDIYFRCDKDPSPPAVLMLCVSQTAAEAVHWNLLNLCLKQDKNNDIEKASPFIVLSMEDPLEGMQGALFRSHLDIDCLNSLQESVLPGDADNIQLLKDFEAPFLSLDDSIELIRRTRRDSHLLGLLGLEKIDKDHDGLLCDQFQNPTPLIQLEGDSQERMDQELEEEEGEIETEFQPAEEEREQEVKSPAATKEEPTSMYTLCHRRTKGSYSMSLCKPDPSWIKYRHQSFAHRQVCYIRSYRDLLIQFPPPPLKGGITVTMEDLQCLDSGLFLNDVIIDFYLKYLLHKAAAAVTERCHIFSSFFFKQLTRRDNASEGSIKDSCQRQRRHQRVKTWTRHVDIFKKEFLFVPVNQEAHWYLVVICFPGLMKPQVEAWKGPMSDCQTGKSLTCELPDREAPNDETETAPPSMRCGIMDTGSENTQTKTTKGIKPAPVSCTEGTFQKKTVCKRSVILV